MQVTPSTDDLLIGQSQVPHLVSIKDEDDWQSTHIYSACIDGLEYRPVESMPYLDTVHFKSMTKQSDFDFTVPLH